MIFTYLPIQQGATAFIMASQNNHVKVVQLLLDYDAEINQQWVRLKYYRVASRLAYLAAMR